MNRLLLTLGLGLAGLPATALADDPFEAIGSAGDYTLLGVADSYTGTSSGFVQLGSAAHVFGHVGARWRIETAAGVVIDGDSHYGDGGSLHAGSIGGTDEMLTDSDWASIQDDAWAAVDAAFELDATELAGADASSCTGSTTASGSIGSQRLVANRDAEGLSVYEFDGCLFLADGETLAIEGTPEDRFVIRVTGGLRMDGGSAIVLDGLPGSAVMFVFDDGGWSSAPWAQVTVWTSTVDEGASLSGVFLAPAMYWQLGDGTLLPDTRILAGGVQANIQDMHSTDPLSGSPLEPGDDDSDDDGDDEPDEPGDEDGPIWGGGGSGPCPQDGWYSHADDDGDSSDDSSTGIWGDGGSDDEEHELRAVEDGSSPSKSPQGCAVVGVEAGGLAVWMGLMALGMRRREDG